MQAYNVELKQCLVSLNEHADKAVEDRMLQLGLEALRIAGCQLLLNPAAVKHLLHGRMSHGSQPAHQLDHTFYVNLLVSFINYTDSSILFLVVLSLTLAAVKLSMAALRIMVRTNILSPDTTHCF